MNSKFKNYLTSELLFHAIQDKCDEQELLLDEYKRRLKELGLNDAQIERFRKIDTAAIQAGCYMDLNSFSALHPFIKPDMNKRSINPEKCTLSELVYLIDDSNYFYSQGPTCLPKEAWELAKQHTLYYCINEASYTLRKHRKRIGMNLDQLNLFIKYECLIIKRLRVRVTPEHAW